MLEMSSFNGGAVVVLSIRIIYSCCYLLFDILTKAGLS